MPVDIRQENASNLLRLAPGMSRQEVVQIMGTGVETVQEGVYHQQKLMGYFDLTVSNPYRSETANIGGDRFEILYYYAMAGGMGVGYWDTYFGTGMVPDWCLTPLVFKNGSYVGRGAEVMERFGLAEPAPVQDQDRSILVGS